MGGVRAVRVVWTTRGWVQQMIRVRMVTGHVIGICEWARIWAGTLGY